MAEQQENKKIEYAVHLLIKLSDGRVFSRLRKENESAIVRAIKKKLRKEFLDTLSLRDHYISKLNRIANSSISSEQALNNKRIAQEQSTNSYKGLEARYISNLYHATKYIDNVILKDQELVIKIENLIEKHVQFQEESKLKRQSVHSEPNKRPVIKLSKLANINFETSKKDIERKQVDLKNALEASDNDTMKELKLLYQESLHLLQLWKIPLFCIAEYLEYPGIEDHKSQLLNYLMSKFHEHSKI